MTSDSKHLPSFSSYRTPRILTNGIHTLVVKIPDGTLTSCWQLPWNDPLLSGWPGEFPHGRKWHSRSCVSRSWPSTNSGIRSSWDRSINSGNHDAAGCSWAIKITSTPGDWAIFCNTCGTILNDRNAYKKVPPVVPRHGHGICPLRPGVRIMTAIRAWRVVCWRMSQTNRSVANRGRRLSMAIVHSVVSVWPTLDRESAWMLCTPGRWMEINVIALLSQHLSSRMVICIKVCDLVPPPPPLILDVRHCHCVVAHQSHHSGPQTR